MSNTVSKMSDILNLVLKSMVSIENVSKLSGDEKKMYVISLLERQLPNYEDYKDIIPVIIELVIVLSRQKIPINIKKLEVCCFA